MKEINIARSIAHGRHKKGITQDELAKYIGVSKASVSKWETGQSYPDISFLPQLAAYFNISVDELIGYEPQMTKEDIRKLYLSLSDEFSKKEFDEVLIKCRDLIKKYYSCFPLLFHMGLLLFNYSSSVGNKERTSELISEAKELFIRVRAESEDIELASQAVNLEACCCLMLGDPATALELLEESITPKIYSESLLASAYQMSGDTRQAAKVLQTGIYTHLLALLDIMTQYLSLCSDNPERLIEVFKRISETICTFEVEGLHPSTLMSIYLASAQSFAGLGDSEKALELLGKYCDLVTGNVFPLKLRGDDFFYLLDEWFEDFDLGTAMPRDEKTVRQSICNAVVNNPAFDGLKGEYRFLSIVDRLSSNCEEA